MKLSVWKKGGLAQEINLADRVVPFDYSETIFLVGRSDQCHIILNDKKISREHFKIKHLGGSWSVEKMDPDLSGKINGENFFRCSIKNGDVLSVDEFQIKIGNVEQETVGNFDSKLNKQDEELGKPKNREINEAVSNKSSDKIEQVNQSHEPAEQEVKSNDYSDDKQDDDLLQTLSGRDSLSSVRNENIALNPSTEDEDLDVEHDFVDSSLFPDDSDGSQNVSNGHMVENANEDYLSNQESSPVSGDEVSAYSLDELDNEIVASDDSTKFVDSFSKIYLELTGKNAPYDVFVVEKDKVFIGRDPNKCQLILNDPGVSAVHAVLTRTNLQLKIEDNNSSNGTIVNGEKVNKAILKHNDVFKIGSIGFKVKIKSDFLENEKETLMPVDENQLVEVEEIVEVPADSESFDSENISSNQFKFPDKNQEKSILKRIWKDEEQRKKLIYGLVFVAVAWFLFDDDKPDAPSESTKPKKTKTKKVLTATSSQKKLTDEQVRAFSALYEIGKTHYQNGRYREALTEFQKIAQVDPNFNSSLQSLIALSKEGLSRIEEEEKKRQAELLMAEKKVKVKKLLEDAREYTKDRKVDLANITFNEIIKLDPENLELTRLKLELDDWVKEEQRKALEEAQKKKERAEKVEKLKPGKTFYLQKEWFKAISKLEDFLEIKDMDEDLTIEATSMLKSSRDELSTAVSPLVGKAKSLLEGQDLKGAYEVYIQILKIEPSNAEALNQVGDIKEQLENRARKIYREAIISESLSLFQDAKEKFQEVQQISPVDSDYYKKATEKIKEYLE